MNAAPFDVRPLIERLRAAVPALRQVAGAADLAAVTQLADFPAPCAYVLLAREQAEERATGITQRGQQQRLLQGARVSFAVVVAVRNYREQRGAQVAPELQSILGAIRAALIGYAPDVDGARPCQLKQGELTRYDAATALWTDVYQTHHTIGASP